MKKILTSVVLFAAGLFAANAQQLQTGDTFTYTNADGVEKTYKVVGENLITNPSFDNGTEGWTGGGGGALGNTEVNNSGGVDGGAYIRPTSSSGKGDNNSIGTAWDVEVGKTYVFSFFMKNQSNTAAESPAGDGYIKVSMSNTHREETLVLQPLPHVDADLAWTQNTWVVTAEYTSLALCARWLGGAKCFDAFILAEVEEAADTKELETLLSECAEWLDHFGDEAKELDAINGLMDDAEALIEGGEFTAADLNAMVATLKEGLLDFRMANANDENTVDVTARYINNTKFDNSWTGWDVVGAAVNNGMNIRNFAYFEESVNPVAEINGQPSSEVSISQTVHGLPLGYYRFTVQCVMSHSVDLTADPEGKSGAVIFCNGSELDMVTKEQTAGGAAHDASYPETFTIEGIVSGDSMVVGFKGLPGTNFTYVAIDNVRLEFAGFDAGIYIDALGNQIYEWMEENSDMLLPGIGYTLEDEINLSTDATTDEEMTAAYIRLDSVFNNAKEAVALMKKLTEDYTAFAEEVQTTQYPNGIDAATAVIAEIEAFLSLEDEEANYQSILDMVAKLKQALADYRMSQESTKDQPGNYSFFIQNPNFEAKDGWTWNLTHDGGGSDIWVGGCRPTTADGENRQGLNIWGNHIVSIDVQQTLTGLPNGLYAISGEMITQTGYATDQHLYVESSINTATSPYLEAEGWDNYEWTTLTTGYAIVNDGNLVIGAGSNTGGSASEGWFQLTNVQLYYYGEASAEDLAAAYEATIAKAEGLVATLLPGDAAVLSAKIAEAKALESQEAACALLQEPIKTATAAAGVYASFKNGAYKTVADNKEALSTAEAIEVLGAALGFADAITAADTTTTAALNAIEEKLNAYNDYATYLEEVGYMVTDKTYAQANINDVKATIAAQKADLLAEFQSSTNVADLKAKLESVVTYLIKSAFFHAKAGDDATALIANPTFDSNATGWLVNKGKGNSETNAGQHWYGDTGNRYMDSYNGTAKALNFRASQVLTDIPNGTYTVKVATRANNTGAYLFALGEAITDTLVNDSTVMLQVAASANTKWVEIAHYGDSLGGIWQAEDDKFMAGETFDETIHNVKNGVGYGWTWQTIDDVVVTNHEMVIGVTTDSTVTKKAGFEGNWFSVDDWSLTIKAVGDNNGWTIESGIENVAATVQKTVYYAIDGRQLAIPGKGVNIVKTVYSDGRIEVKKVYVK